MSYWIYENWVAENKAVVHVGSCRYCNEGRGCHVNVHENKNGKWNGPFIDRNSAENAAISTGRRLCCMNVKASISTG